MENGRHYGGAGAGSSSRRSSPRRPFPLFPPFPPTDTDLCECGAVSPPGGRGAGRCGWGVAGVLAER